MKSVNFSIKFLFLFFTLALVIFTGCKEEFDEPPVKDLPNIQANASIAEVKALHTIGSDYVPITEDWIISGIITADDESGNFFKSLVFEDSTGALEIRVNVVGLFGNYPVGTELFVICDGLYIGDFNGKPQIAGDSIGNAIEELLAPMHLIAGAQNMPLTPTTVTISELGPQYVNRLIKLENVEFVDSETGVTYADAANQLSVNRSIQDCDKNTVLLRSSGFADFAAELTPSGNGSLVAIYSVFGNDEQLFIRDLEDINMNGPRCGQDVTVNTTLGAIKDLNPGGGEYFEITDELVFEGVVVADDESGNFFKTLVIEDGTDGIEIRLDALDLYQTYPVGSQVFVNCQGLFIGSFNGKPQLVSNPDGDRIEESRVPGVVIPGAQNQPINPPTLSIPNISAQYINRLIRIENVEFVPGDIGVTYADAVNQFSVNLTLQDCDDNEIILRSSGFADFADATTPDGNGSIEAIYSVFGDDRQLFIRDLGDVNMTGVRCEQDTVVDAPLVDIADVRAEFTGGASSASEGKIKGIVISDRANGNEPDPNLVIQDATGGIVVRFDGVHNFDLGDEIEVIITDLELSEFEGLLQINNTPPGNATQTGSGSITPAVVTISQILVDFENFESTLVQINNATISGSTFDFSNNMISDGTGTLTMFTRSQATWAGQSVPSGTVSITGYITEFDGTEQLKLRNLDDID